MPASAMIGNALVRSNAQVSDVQTTVVTLDREWAAALAQELRDHHIPTLVPASPARWREHFDSSSPNCVIFDLDHGGEGAFEAIAAIKAQSRLTMIVAAASAPSIKTVVAAMRAGAIDFVNKRHPLRAAREQIQDAADHALARQTATVEHGVDRARIEALTARERDVLARLAAGLATKQIAHAMDLSPRTVEMFRGRIKRRLDVGSVPEAISLWLSHSDEPRLRVAA